MADYKIISSDNHVFEPLDLWTSRTEPKFKGRMPHLERVEDGDWWFCDGAKICGTSAGTQAGVRFEDQTQLQRTRPVEEIRPGGWIPEEHVKDMEEDGVYGSIIYPSVGLDLFENIEDTELLSEIFRIYNDWLAEFCNAFPDRLKGVAMLNVDDVKLGVKELERCAKMGLGGGMITVYPPPGQEYNLPEYDLLWAAAQDLQIPLALHITTARPGPGQQAVGATGNLTPAFQSNMDYWVRMSLAHIIFSGAFQRFPNLHIGAVEHELSWVPYFLDRMDYTYTQRTIREGWWDRFTGDGLPSEYFKSNVFLGFQEDARGIRDRHAIGVDNLMWGSDYPHTESTFPKSQQILEEILVDCTEEEKAKIAGGNAARIYNLN